MTIITGQNLTLAKNGKRILEIPSFEVREGEVLGIIGPNGAGKSSLLHLLAFLEQPTQGEIFFRGQRPRTKAEVLAVRRKMAVVFQEPLLLRDSVFNNVALGLKFRKQKNSKEKVNFWLEKLGITFLARQDARTLSGGEAQRVALARAFVLEPEVLFLDEPFSSLDAFAKIALMEELREILAATGTTTVFITHDFQEVSFLADRVAVLTAGKVNYVGTPTEPEISLFLRGPAGHPGKPGIT